MKKIIFIIFITLLAFNSQSQNRLSFSKVNSFVKDTSFVLTQALLSENTTWDIYNVLPSRTAKINNIHFLIENDGEQCSYSVDLLINNIVLDEFTENDEMFDYLENTWLESGNTLSIGFENTTGSQSVTSGYDASGNPYTIYGPTPFCNTNIRYLVSIIEYKIIPE